MAFEPCAYLFVDGGYLRMVWQERMVPFVGEQVQISYPRLITCASMYVRKVMYYDCLDDIARDSEPEEEYRRRVERQEKVFNEIRSLDRYHVQLGTLRGTQRRRRQKEVDVLLTVDMLTNAFRQNFTTAVLLAGDLDFKPVVQNLVQNGTDVLVLWDARSGSEELAFAADSQRRITLDDLWNWSDHLLRSGSENLFPKRENLVNEPLSHAVRQGVAGDRKFSVYEEGEKFIWYFLPSPGVQSLKLVYHSFETLERYVIDDFGPITWL